LKPSRPSDGADETAFIKYGFPGCTTKIYRKGRLRESKGLFSRNAVVPSFLRVRGVPHRWKKRRGFSAATGSAACPESGPDDARRNGRPGFTAQMSIPEQKKKRWYVWG
jgi:hypothetical protein